MSMTPLEWKLLEYTDAGGREFTIKNPWRAWRWEAGERVYIGCGPVTRIDPWTHVWNRRYMRSDQVSLWLRTFNACPVPVDTTPALDEAGARCAYSLYRVNHFSSRQAA